MKIKAYYIFLLFTVLFAMPVIAQVNRNVAPGQYRQPKGTGGKFDFVVETVKYYKKELNLDDFQAAAIKEIITAEKDNITNVQQQTDMTAAERKDKAKEINDRIDAKMLPMLTAEQVKKYEKLKEKRKG
jgi:Spy/CpxP family protein refolding chaperone